MAVNPQDIRTFYFIISLPKAISSQAEIKTESKSKSVRPIRKILEKDFKAVNNQDFTSSVYAGEIIPSLVKDKNIKVIKNLIKAVPIDISIKIQKNKFETNVHAYLQITCFTHFVPINPIKKVIGKDIDAPQQIELLPFQYLSLFREALLSKEKKMRNDPVFLDFLRYGTEILKSIQVAPFKLFLLVYENILNSWDIPLLNEIFNYFHLKRIEIPKVLPELTIFQEPLMLIYGESEKYIENIRRIPNVNFELYLMKFYTVNIYYHATMRNIQKVEEIMINLRDHNPYDYLILPKLFLSDYNIFYRSIPINIDLKMSLIDSYIIASSSYENLTTAFSMITEYVQSDFNTILLVLIKNYEKINKICVDNNKPFKINDYIIQKYEDDLNNVQNSLVTLGQLKLSHAFKAIDFRIDMWDMYLIEGNNPQFLEFLKSHLIQTAFYLSDIKEALGYIIKFTKKNMITMLEMLVKNYDKIESICLKEKKYIEVVNYVQPNASDNIDAIKEHFNYILERKMKINYETLYFKIDIWLFYINNKFNHEFLLYLEKKLFESALYYDDILDCITFGSTLRDRVFAPVLELIINNFEKIHMFVKNKKTSVEFKKYFTPDIDTDNLEQIYDLLRVLMEKEIAKGYKTVNLSIYIWEPYSNIQNLNILRLLRKIILECYKMDTTLTEMDIDLARKIHDVGFIYIRQGKLLGDKLLEFLGVEEAFYVEGQINSIIATNKHQQQQLDAHLKTIKYLSEENVALKTRVTGCEAEISYLKSENAHLSSRVSSLEGDVSSLWSRVKGLESDVSSLRWRTS